MKTRLLNEFHVLAAYLAAEGRIRAAAEYRRNFPALVSFARRLAAYALVDRRCRGKKVLDIGCSLGHGSRLLSEGAESVAAVDSDACALRAASRERTPDNVRFVRSRAERLPFPEGAFGAVIAFHLIEHLQRGEAKAFLREVRRVAEKGGEIFFTTPNRRFRLLPLQRRFNPEHRREFTCRRLRRTLQAVFEDSEIMGIRGRDWVEEIERERVRASPLQAYLRNPLAALLKRASPALHRKFRAVYGNKTMPDQGKRGGLVEEPGGREISIDDYFTDGRNPERGIDLLAICRKNTGI